MDFQRLHLDLAETAKDYAIEHFSAVTEGEEFLHLSPEYIQVFLDSPYLGIDSDGQLLISPGTGGSSAAGITIQADQKILATGNFQNGLKTDAFISRLNVDGSWRRSVR